MPGRENGSLERNIGDKRVESKCQKDKMMVSSENVGKVTVEREFPCAVLLAVISSYASLASAGYIINVMLLEVN